jgi:hypothetical protein
VSLVLSEKSRTDVGLGDKERASRTRGDTRAALSVTWRHPQRNGGVVSCPERVGGRERSDTPRGVPRSSWYSRNGRTSGRAC